jgi:hypothetical protein
MLQGRPKETERKQVPRRTTRKTNPLVLNLIPLLAEAKVVPVLARVVETAMVQVVQKDATVVQPITTVFTSRLHEETSRRMR